MAPSLPPARTKKKSHGNAREKEKKGRRPGTLGQEKGRDEGGGDPHYCIFLEERFRHFLETLAPVALLGKSCLVMYSSMQEALRTQTSLSQLGAKGKEEKGLPVAMRAFGGGKERRFD